MTRIKALKQQNVIFQFKILIISSKFYKIFVCFKVIFTVSCLKISLSIDYLLILFDFFVDGLSVEAIDNKPNTDETGKHKDIRFKRI